MLYPGGRGVQKDTKDDNSPRMRGGGRIELLFNQGKVILGTKLEFAILRPD